MTGSTVIGWVIRAFLAICIFILAVWIIPVLFGLVHVTLPDQIVTVLGLLIAVGFFFWAPPIRLQA